MRHLVQDFMIFRWMRIQRVKIIFLQLTVTIRTIRLMQTSLIPKKLMIWIRRLLSSPRRKISKLNLEEKLNQFTIKFKDGIQELSRRLISSLVPTSRHTSIQKPQSSCSIKLQKQYACSLNRSSPRKRMRIEATSLLRTS